MRLKVAYNNTSIETSSNLFVIVSSGQTKRQRDGVPVAMMTPTIAEITVAEMTNMAIDTAPTYTATKQAKNKARNPPAAAKDIRTETIMALAVATSRKDMKISRPVSDISVIVPT